MPDIRPDPAPLLDDAAALRLRRQRARSIVMAVALLLWALLIYGAIMFKIDADIKHPPQHDPAADQPANG